MIAGLESITDGEVSIDSKVVNRLPPRERDVAMVFQSYALYPHMTVGENMGFSLKLAKQPKAEIERRVGLAAEILDLQPLLDRKPAQLSGGQRQRVAMGRSIVRDPKVFLFDEPLSNLDAKLRVQMRSEIKGLHKRLRTTIVYVTHDQVEAMTMADRIVVMNAGVIEQIGTPMELYGEPQSLFVAGFIGSPAMNFLTGTIDGVSGKFVSERGTEIILPAAAAHEKRSAILGIRPEDLLLGNAGAVVVEGKVALVEPMGADTLITLELAGDTLLVLLREQASIDSGQTIQLSVEANKLHFFDPANGKRL
ncbi:multiple sugar transport system ATP-binding protein [Martelella mediterranea]|uniref:Multiple sugar transport system ATP-binding protein n=1 Tax=Martelella mediterranea TaxID=293089 RepID=A0A4R3NNI0_9HYPH|nr:multiple sugar transport system ATP-binding protein [Martelella mediterranea]